jgi:hypothetical protein
MSLVSNREFRTAWKEIEHLFVEKSGQFHHELVDEKRPQLVEYKQKQSDAGKKGAQARLQGLLQGSLEPNGKGRSSEASRVVQAPIPIPIIESTVLQSPKKTDAPVCQQPPKLFEQRFEEFWNLYPAHRRGHRATCENLLFLVATEDAMRWDEKWERLIAPLRPGGKWAASADWTKDAGRFVCKAQTYLMDSKWNETPMPAKVEEVWVDHLKTVEFDERFR